MRPPLCTDADDLVRCSATVGNLGERRELDILTYVRHWDLLHALRTGQSTRYLHFKHESELHMSARTPAACVTGERATIEPLIQICQKLIFVKRVTNVTPHVNCDSLQ